MKDSTKHFGAYKNTNVIFFFLFSSFRGNLITEGKALQSIGLVAKSLQALVLSENPLVATSDYRFSVLTLLPHLKRLDKEPVSPEERSENQMRIRVKSYLIFPSF